MKTNTLFSIVLAMFLPLAACESDPGGTDPTDTGTDSDVPIDTEEYGMLSVDTTPDGATLTLNEEVKGTTPITLESLTPGAYSVRISLAGYLDYVDTVTVSADATTPLDVTLEPEGTDYDLNDRWVHDGTPDICDVTQTGDQVRGFCGCEAASLTLTGSSLAFSDSDVTITGEVLDEDHVSLTIEHAWGTDNFSYTRL